MLKQGRSAIRELAEQVTSEWTSSTPAPSSTPSPRRQPPRSPRSRRLRKRSTRRGRGSLKPGPINPDLSFSVQPGSVRLLHKQTDDVMALYELARTLARAVEYDLGSGDIGGGSDGNFSEALGIDGLGLSGDGFHTHSDHVDSTRSFFGPGCSPVSLGWISSNWRIIG